MAAKANPKEADRSTVVVREDGGVGEQVTPASLSERLFRTLLDVSPDAVLVCDFDPDTGISSTFTEANQAACDTLGYTREELLRLRPTDLYGPDDRRITLDDIKAFMKSGSAVFDRAMLTKSGERLFAELNLRLMTYEGRMISVGVIRDKTQLHRTEKEVREARDLSQRYLDIAAVMIVALDMQGNVTLANRKACDVLGYSESELLGRNWFESFLPEWTLKRRPTVEAWLQTRGNDEARSPGSTLITRTGEERTILWRNTELRDESGNVIGILGSGADVTERTLAEEALAESEMMNRSLLEGSPICTKIIGTDRKMHYMSAAGINALGIDDVQPYYEQTYPPDFYPESIRATLEDKLTLALSGKTCTVDAPVHNMEGEELWFQTTFVPVLDDERAVKHVIAASVDISERRRAEEALRDSMERHRALYDYAPLPYQALDDIGQFIDVNPAWLATLGYSRDEVIGTRYMDLLHPESREDVRRTYPGFKERGYIRSAERMIRHKDGRYLCVSFGGRMSYWPNGEVHQLYEVFEDITERKAAQDALRKSEGELMAIFKNSPCVLVFTDMKGVVLATNHPDTKHGETNQVGDSFTSFLCNDEQIALYRAAIEETMLTGKPAAFEVTTPTGGEMVDWLQKVSVVTTDGRPTGLVISCADVTERNRAESALRESEARLRLMFEGSRALIVLTDSAAMPVWANPAWEDAFGPVAAIKSPQPLRVHADDEDRVLAGMEALRSGKQERIDLEYRYRKPDGEYRIFDARAFRLELTEGHQYCIISNDITEREASAALLRQNERSLRSSVAEIERLKELLEAENTYLREAMRASPTHGEVVMDGAAMRAVMKQAARVAQTPSTVLITGETGTGKELLARAIHELSPRKEQPLVVVNCAAMPETLVESELFGREKGAFTGAVSKQIGRFEVANGSTIFLDEIGELPLGTQAKLLRVLEQGQIERLGSTKTIEVDARVVVATNRDLEEAVRDGSFRRDLFYRLNVFPIHIPPLRERIDDIPALVDLFVEQFSDRMGMRAGSVSEECLEALREYPWPGNIRELRNLIERAMIRSRGSELNIELPKAVTAAEGDVVGAVKLTEVERDHIVSVLKSVGWRVRGRGGAAELLDLKPSTLESRMKKLGIKRPE